MGAHPADKSGVPATCRPCCLPQRTQRVRTAPRAPLLRGAHGLAGGWRTKTQDLPCSALLHCGDLGHTRTGATSGCICRRVSALGLPGKPRCPFPLLVCPHGFAAEASEERRPSAAEGQLPGRPRVGSQGPRPAPLNWHPLHARPYALPHVDLRPSREEGGVSCSTCSCTSGPHLAASPPEVLSQSPACCLFLTPERGLREGRARTPGTQGGARRIAGARRSAITGRTDGRAEHGSTRGAAERPQ